MPQALSGQQRPRVPVKDWTGSAKIEFHDEDEIFVGRIAGINDAIGFGAKSVADLKAAFREAADDYLETCAKLGQKPQKPYTGKMMFRVDPEVHRKAALQAELSGKSLNNGRKRP